MKITASVGQEIRFVTDIRFQTESGIHEWPTTTATVVSPGVLKINALGKWRIVQVSQLCPGQTLVE